MKRLIFIALIFLTKVSWGQNEIQLKNNGHLKKLFESPNTQINVTSGSWQNVLIKITDQKKVGYVGSFIKTKNGLYYFLNGSGRLYKTEKINDSTFLLRRIDSTHFYGYNGASIPFAYNDTIFSFGGNGFWRVNGHLRHFSTNSHEWNITPINEEVPALFFNYYQDFKEYKLYYVQFPFYDPVINKNHEDYTLYELDLSSKFNRKLGILNKHITDLIKMPNVKLLSVVAPNLGGTVIFLNPEYAFLLNYKEGTVYKLAQKTISNEIYGRSDGQELTDIFTENDSVFYVLSGDTTHALHSFRLSKADFIKENYKLYDSVNSIHWQGLILAGSIFLIALGIVYFFFYKKKSAFTSVLNNISQDQTESLSYKPLELELIEMILENGKHNKKVLVEDINSVLGLSKKALEIQKKVRTETINRINHKFRVLNDIDADLIVRIRSENDKRFYRYYIPEEFVKLLNILH